MEPKESTKSIWNRPEGWGIIGLGFIMCLFALFATNTFFAVVASTMALIFQSTITLIATGAVILATTFLCTNKGLHVLVWNMYKIAMRSIAGFIITIDPIGILKNGILDMKHHKDKLDENRDELSGGKVKLDKKIDDNNTQAKKCIKEAEQARDRMSKAVDELDRMNWNKELQLKLMKAGGLQETNKKLIPIQINMGKMCDFLKKASWAADFTIRKAEMEVELKEAEWDAIQTSHKALRSAMSAFNGNPDQRALLEQTIEYMESDMSKKVGEMKRIMEVSSTFINAADLESDANFNDGMKLLDSFMETGNLSLIADAETANKPGAAGFISENYFPQTTLGESASTSVKQSNW